MVMCGLIFTYWRPDSQTVSEHSLKEFRRLPMHMEAEWSVLRDSLVQGIPDTLPEHPGFDESVDHACEAASSK